MGLRAFEGAVTRSRVGIQVGSITVFSKPPRDWLAAGVLTPRTPLLVERIVGRLATVRRVDGRPFAFTHGCPRQTRVPLDLLTTV